MTAPLRTAVAALALALAAAGPRPSYEGLRIGKVGFEGLQNVRRETVRAAVGIKTGDTYQQTRLSEVVKSLQRTGLFADVRVEAVRTDDPSTVDLVFRLREYPQVKAVQFEGMRKVSSSDVSEEIKKILPEGEVATPRRIREAKESVLAKYRQEGYLFTAVTVEERPEKRGQVTLVFRVDEGAKTVVRRLGVEGNTVFPARRILGRMETKPRDWLHSGVFDPEKFESDLEKVLGLYRDNGHINARIVRTEVRTNVVVRGRGRSRTEMRELSILLVLEEGDRFVFDGYGPIEGTELFSTNEIRKVLKLRPGSVFNQSRFMQDLMAVQQLYGGRGYIFAQVIPRERVDATNRRIAFGLTVYEGEIAHIESIVIQGNTKTKEHVIRRELSVREGDIFDADKIRRSREKVFNLGFFRNVGIDTRPGSAEGLMVLVVDVEEQPTGMITLGATFAGSGRNFRPGGYQEVSENNFLGRGYRIREKVAINTSELTANAEFSTPWLFDTPTSASVSAYYSWNRLNISNINNLNTNNIYNKMETGVVLGLGRRLDDYTRINGTYNVHYYEHYRLGADVPTDLVRPGGFFRNLVQLGFEYDSRDNVFDATRGANLRLGFETSYGLAGNDIYNKYTADVSLYRRTFWKFVLVGHANLGVIGHAFWSPRHLDIKGSDLFYLGSVDTVRGYSQAGGAVPWQVTLGRAVNYYNLEHRFPLVEQVLGLSTFLDCGNLWATPEEMKFDFLTYGYAVGLGLRVQIPMLPLRFYLSWPFRHTEGRGWHFEGRDVWESMRFEFSIGGTF